ncbi:RNA-binding protein [Trypanosoma cruzi Dm28c]|uniref:RNA-binding protein n=2 Tax=Trypanosoma cruzi TaxID=5693 RepID=V5BGL1_TRYCR|nr:RNA-binding protein [Trypanosoma cruzi Dm28c]PBJ74282.1 RNA-binding protein [Trypanosoma cruzi cruzi]PWU86727.1 putative RNA-binding protein [Trypanosoma cruzi]
MPSRAVLRKKARRESKHRRLEAEDAAVDAALLACHGAQSHLPLGAGETEKGVETAARKRPRNVAVVEAAAETVESMAGMSHKERKRFEAKQRFERQLAKLNAAVEKEENTTATKTETAMQAAEAGTDALSPTREETLRHDPKFKNGTFWRMRKERRGRTVFLGNMPARFTVQEVKDFVSSVFDAYCAQKNEDVNKADEEREEGSVGVAVVDLVDFLPAPPRVKHRHMFVTLQSKEVAEQVVKLLDAYKLDGVTLRCNFASDKAQRGEAIRRRLAAPRVRS